MRKNLSQLKEELHAAGFRPAPLAPILHFIRRLIWPLIRQYHFYQLEQLDCLTQQLRDHSESQINQLAALQARQIDQLSQACENAKHLSTKLTEELSKLITSHFQLQTDFAALSNRWAARLAADGTAQDALRAMDSQNERLMEHIQALKQYQEAMESQLLTPFQRILPSISSTSDQEPKSDLHPLTPTGVAALPPASPRQFLPLESTLGSAIRACADQALELKTQFDAARLQVSTVAARAAEQDSRHAAAIAELQASASAVRELLNTSQLQSSQKIAALDAALKQLPEAAALHRIVDLSAKAQVLVEDIQRLRADMQLQSSANGQLSSQLALGISLLSESTRKTAELESAQEAASSSLVQQEKSLTLLAERLLSLSGEIQAATGSVANCWSKVNLLDHRTTLSFVHTPDRIYITKSGDLIGEILAQTGSWDAHIVSAGIQTAASRRGIAVDIGAHIGTISCALSSHFDKIVCFEPNHYTFPLLKANLALNGIQNIEAIPGALYSRELNLSLARSADQEIPLPLTMGGGFDPHLAGNLGALAFTPNGTGIFETPARTLDSYSLQNVSFLKVDAQGADGEVLMGAKQTILRCRPVIVFEWEEFLSKSHDVNLDFLLTSLRDWGYNIEILKQTNEKQADYIARPV